MRFPEALRSGLRRADTRAGLVIGGLLLVAVALQAALLYVFVAVESLEEADTWVEHGLRVSLRALASENGSAEIEAFRGSFTDFVPSVRVESPEGEVLEQWGPWPTAAHAVVEVAGDDARGYGAYRLLQDGNFVVGEGILPSGAVARVALPLAHFAEETREVGWGLGLIALVSGLAAVVFAVLATGRSFAPLRRATQLIRSFDARNLDARLATRGTGDPIDRHAEELNRVLASLRESFERLRAFTSDAAHELRTPLNRITNVADVALLGSDDAELRPALEAVQRTSRELASMVQSLLLLAEVSDRRLALHPDSIDVEAWLQRTVDAYEPLFEEKQVKLELRSESLRVVGDRQLLDRVLLNLVENALRYTRPGDSVCLSARAAGGGLVVTVEDSGPGVLAPERERIFERFARLSPQADSTGVGLGLALARAIARLHDGDLVLEESALGGAAFVWTLPHLDTRSEA